MNKEISELFRINRSVIEKILRVLRKDLQAHEQHTIENLLDRQEQLLRKILKEQCHSQNQA